MLIGAAVGATAGGAGAAIQGGDPLKGALMGGAMGAVGGGLGGAMGAGGGAAAGTTGATTAGTVGATTAGTTAGTVAGTTGGGLTASSVPTLTGGLGVGSGGVGAAPSIFGGASQGVAGATNIGAGISGAGTGGGTALTSGLGIAQGSALPAGFGTAGTTAGTNIFGQTLGQPGVLSNTALGMTAGTAGLAGLMQAERDTVGGVPTVKPYDGPLSKLRYDPDKFTASAPTYAPTGVYRPTYTNYAAEGGIMKLAQGGMPGPVERMSANALGGGTNMFPQSQQERTNFATPTQMPASAEVTMDNQYRGVTMAGGGIADLQIMRAIARKKRQQADPGQVESAQLQGLNPSAYNDIYGQGLAIQQQLQQPAQGQGQAMAGGGYLGGYSDGGRMLKGPGDGMSDNIPATIAGKQPARLADGEFVVPADVVSHLGNGSTDAGAKQLYAMMNRVRKARTGNPKQGKQIKPAKYMAA
jgi:hypothetical protein